MDTREMPTIELQRDAVYDAVLHAGKPVLLKDIYSQLKDSFPGLVWKRMSIHISLENDDRIGCFLRKGNTWYDIKKFEEDWKCKNEKIQDLVFDFLTASSGPVHISEIVTYVSRFHEVDEKTIKLIIKIDLKGKCIPHSHDYYEIIRTTPWQSKKRIRRIGRIHGRKGFINHYR